MNWELAVTATVAVLGANAFLMKLVIRSEINAFHVLMNKEFVTKAECKHCQGE